MNQALPSGFQKLCRIVLICCAISGATAQNEITPTIQLPAALVGQYYNYQLQTAQPGATFVPGAGTNAAWLHVSAAGLLYGTPDRDAPERSSIQVVAQSGSTQFAAILVVPVETNVCPAVAAARIDWCAPVPNRASYQAAPVAPPAPATPIPKMLQFNIQSLLVELPGADEPPVITQFNRTKGDRGKFGTLEHNRLQLDQDPCACKNIEISKIENLKVLRRKNWSAQMAFIADLGCRGRGQQ